MGISLIGRYPKMTRIQYSNGWVRNMMIDQVEWGTFYTVKPIYNVINPIINLPFGDGLYNQFMMILGW